MYLMLAEFITTIMSDCDECKKAELNDRHGVYISNCVGCCARLVISARPSKTHQDSMFAAIDRMNGSPARQEIIDFIKGKN